MPSHAKIVVTGWWEIGSLHQTCIARADPFSRQGPKQLSITRVRRALIWACNEVRETPWPNGGDPLALAGFELVYSVLYVLNSSRGRTGRSPYDT